ncbi:hypothetical protein IL252_13810 [Halomicrobium sp. IBSBa]|uniref:hypothetical protein n=1 Tax=Halomicrobium sp. IBSBa TaxID=2778916 RepID=UPI001ABF1707|nr:hypothetical protein [Halomicrobium sp. IBSBa]MBO4248893.1 hypothetical protein [Halomicrobium sp. IBSBa]
MAPFGKGLKILRHQGLSAFTWKVLRYTPIWYLVWNTVTSRAPVGTNIYERDWDLLIILDACRVDSLQRFSDSKPYLDDIQSIQSVGSMSAEWMLKTFTGEYRDQIAETAHLSGNIWSYRILEEQFHRHRMDASEQDYLYDGWPHWQTLSADEFGYYEMIWTDVDEDRLHPQNAAIPHILTDRAIDIGREKDFDRLIVHYTLPHIPFIADALDWEPGEMSTSELMDGLDHTREITPTEEAPYEGTKWNEESTDTVKKGFEKNLELVLEYVEILLSNFEAEDVVISADHGEALGEYGLWGHPFGFPLSPVKTVPWAKTTASDERTYETQYDTTRMVPHREEQIEFLEQMGYL